MACLYLNCTSVYKTLYQLVQHFVHAGTMSCAGWYSLVPSLSFSMLTKGQLL